MQKALTIILSLFFPTLLFGQTYFLETGQKKFTAYNEQEKKLGSELLENSSNYSTQSPFHLGQPIRFVRNNSTFYPRAVVEYFFSIPDSTVREIHIELDSLNFLDKAYDSHKKYKEPFYRLDDFNKQYDIIKAELVNRFGQSKEKEELGEKAQFGVSYWNRSDNWKNDSLTVQMYMTFSSEEKEMGSMSVLSTYRIRVSINYKPSNSPSQQSADDFNPIPKQDSVAQLFISMLFKEDYKTSWELIDQDLKDKISYEDYVKAVAPFNDFKKENGSETELFMSGVNINTTGDSNPFYSYKFKSDDSHPPKVMIDVSFKTTESLMIYGIKPKTMMGRVK